jgi:hypothetical protein
MSDDPTLERLRECRNVRDGLMLENAKLRAALLLIREHKLPYPSLSMNLGSNGVRDYFIRVADKALQ